VHILAELPVTTVKLIWDRPIHGRAGNSARQLRGAIASVFSDNSLFHQHFVAGKTLYRYPLIQYRWEDGCGLVVGWLEGAEVLSNISWLETELVLGTKKGCISDALIKFKAAAFGVADRLNHYKLRSPLLLFNQNNYKAYKKMSPQERRDECDRLLVAQILTALRGLHVDFDARLYASFISTRTVPCRYKEQDLIGLTGRFATNAILADGFAIGHAVSHGYGWIQRN